MGGGATAKAAVAVRALAFSSLPGSGHAGNVMGPANFGKAVAPVAATARSALRADAARVPANINTDLDYMGFDMPLNSEQAKKTVPAYWRWIAFAAILWGVRDEVFLNVANHNARKDASNTVALFESLPFDTVVTLAYRDRELHTDPDDQNPFLRAILKQLTPEDIAAIQNRR